MHAFVEPTSRKDAEDRRSVLRRDIQIIQSQLGDRQRKDGQGNLLTGQAYWRWRNSAMVALNAKLEETRLLKKWLSEHRKPRQADAQRLLKDCHDLLKTLREEEVDFDPEEIELIEEVGRFLEPEQAQPASPPQPTARP